MAQEIARDLIGPSPSELSVTLWIVAILLVILSYVAVIATPVAPWFAGLLIVSNAGVYGLRAFLAWLIFGTPRWWDIPS